MLLKKHLTHNYSLCEVAKKTNDAVKFTPASLGEIQCINKVIFMIHYNHNNQRNLSEEELVQNPTYLALSRNLVPPAEPNLYSQNRLGFWKLTAVA